ncbi:MAG: redoxin domain-containing protein [Flavobacteriales bacterium]|nr:redoxin domain-containing protein [Flavobacteriales bacterium]
MPLTIGQTAPGFTLFDTNKNQVSLSDFKGRNVVILFFPFAFTGTCTTELCGVRDHLSDYTDLNAEVLAISVDSLHSLRRYKEDQNFNFTLLSDFNKETSINYESIYEVFAQGAKGVSKRSAFVVDKDGIIRYAEVLENAGEIPDLDAVVRTLQELN